MRLSLRMYLCTHVFSLCTTQVSTEKAAAERRRVNWKKSESLKGNWDVMLCFKKFVDEQPLPGDGIVYVSRKAGCVANDLGFMSNGDVDIAKEARDLFGPDEMIVEFEGPEIVSLQQEHLGACSYRFPFRLTLGGMYFLRITLLRTGWSGLSEMDHSYQRPYFDDVLGELKVFMFEGRAFQKSSNKNALREIVDVHSGGPLPPGDARLLRCDLRLRFHALLMMDQTPKRTSEYQEGTIQKSDQSTTV